MAFSVYCLRFVGCWFSVVDCSVLYFVVVCCTLFVARCLLLVVCGSLFDDCCLMFVGCPLLIAVLLVECCWLLFLMMVASCLVFVVLRLLMCVCCCVCGALFGCSFFVCVRCVSFLRDEW